MTEKTEPNEYVLPAGELADRWDKVGAKRRANAKIMQVMRHAIESAISATMESFMSAQYEIEEEIRELWRETENVIDIPDGEKGNLSIQRQGDGTYIITTNDECQNPNCVCEDEEGGNGFPRIVGYE